MQRRDAPGGGVDRLRRPLEVGGHGAGSQAQEVAVAVAVQPDGVARGDDLGGQRGRAPHLLADEEERRRRAGVLEDVEHRGRALRVRTVVERQRDRVRVG